MTGQDGRTWNDCNNKYSLEWYHNQYVEYKLNYYRHDICQDSGLVAAETDWAQENKIVGEYTFNDGDRNLGDRKAVARILRDRPNIIVEVWNEMYSDEAVRDAIYWAEYLKGEGLIVSGGAIGAGGEEFWFKFFDKKPPVDILQTHQHWPYPGHEDNDWVLLFTKNADPYFNQKPVGRNEFFNLKVHDLETMKFIFRQTFKHGAKLGLYYGFRMDDLWAPCGVDKEGFEYWEMLEFARDLCREMNPS